MDNKKIPTGIGTIIIIIIAITVRMFVWKYEKQVNNLPISTQTTITVPVEQQLTRPADNNLGDSKSINVRKCAQEYVEYGQSSKTVHAKKEI